MEGARRRGRRAPAPPEPGHGRRARGGDGRSLVFGFASATGVARTVAGRETLWVHIALALLAVPLLAWHVVARPVRPRRADVSRRVLLRAGLLAATGGALYAAGEAGLRLAGLPGAKRRFTGSYAADPARMPVVSWLDDAVPDIDGAAWRLAVTDAAGRRDMAPDELAALGTSTVRATLDCTSGWYATHDWTGVPVARLVRVGPEHRSVRVRSATGFDRFLPLSDLDTLLLATACGGAPLTAGHGFPARLGGSGASRVLVGQVGRRRRAVAAAVVGAVAVPHHLIFPARGGSRRRAPDDQPTAGGRVTGGRQPPTPLPGRAAAPARRRRRRPPAPRPLRREERPLLRLPLLPERLRRSIASRASPRAVARARSVCTHTSPSKNLTEVAAADSDALDHHQRARGGDGHRARPGAGVPLGWPERDGLATAHRPEHALGEQRGPVEHGVVPGDVVGVHDGRPGHQGDDLPRHGRLATAAASIDGKDDGGAPDRRRRPGRRRCAGHATGRSAARRPASPHRAGCPLAIGAGPSTNGALVGASPTTAPFVATVRGRPRGPAGAPVRSIGCATYANGEAP